MNVAQAIPLGLMGIIWIAGAFTRPKFPNKNSTIKSIIATVGASIVFFVPILFSSASIATPIELFGFIGCILGLIGCARSMYLIFPNA